MQGFFSIEDEKRWFNLGNVTRVVKSSSHDGNELWSVHFTDGQIVQVTGIDFYRFERMLRENHIELYNE